MKRAGLFFFMLFAISTKLNAENVEWLLAHSVARKSVSTEKHIRIEYTIPKINEKINIDGVLDEISWRSAAKIFLKYETFPGNNTPAPVNTQCLLAFDETNLYFAFVAADPNPENIRAYITDRDNTQGQDRVAIYIDTFNDARRAFDFTVTALGVQFDGIFDQERGRSDQSWDTIWSSNGKITETGFTVEAAIPFKSLSFPGSHEAQTWGFYAARYWPRSSQVEMRSMPWDRDNGCQLCQTNLLTGFQGISLGQNLEFTPSLTGGRTDEREDFTNGVFQHGPVKGDLGLDVRWGVTPELTLNSTLNPDFSQVEADVAQLDVNNRFALFFPEKRPFFLENSDFFNTPFRAVFTRTIADPVIGLKMTGKLGGNAVGTILARDKITNLLVPGNQGSSSIGIENETTVFLNRFRRDIGASSTIGVLYTGREGTSYYNRVGGFDAFLRPFSALTFNFQYLHSETAYPDSITTEYDQRQGGFGGNAYNIETEYRTRTWYTRARRQAKGADFRADSGFISQVDTRDYRFDIQHFFWGGTDRWFTRINLWAGYWHTENFAGRLTDSYRLLSLQYLGPKQSLIWFFPRWKKQYFDGRTYNMFQPFFRFEFRPAGNIFFNFAANVGDAIDFSNSTDAKQINLRPDFNIRLGRHIDLNLRYRFQRLTNQGNEIFTANLLESRAVYNFNPRTFMRAILQFQQIDRNPELYIDEIERRSRNLFMQFLFSYKLNSQSVFFLGYIDNRASEIEENFNQVPLIQTSRSFFMKLAYAWRP